MNTILCPLISMLVNTIVQIAALRSRRGAQFFRSIVEGFMAGAATLAIIEILFAPKSILQSDYLALVFLINTPIYLALSYCAYNFVQLGQTSIRIRMYSEIAASPTGVSVEEMRRQFDDKALVEGRVYRLLESGDILEREGRYYIGRKRLLFIVETLSVAKQFLLGKGSEFEVSE